MSKQPPKSSHNVVSMSAKPAETGKSGRDTQANMRAKTQANTQAKTQTKTSGAGVLAAAGSPDDPRIQEALRLIEAFLAIEDETARSALITLAERLVTFDWARKVQQR